MCPPANTVAIAEYVIPVAAMFVWYVMWPGLARSLSIHVALSFLRPLLFFRCFLFFPAPLWMWLTSPSRRSQKLVLHKHTNTFTGQPTFLYLYCIVFVFFPAPPCSCSYF